MCTFLAHQRQWCLVLPESAPATKILMKTGTHGSVFSASDLLVSDELLRGLRGVENSVNNDKSSGNTDKHDDEGSRKPGKVGKVRENGRGKGKCKVKGMIAAH